MGILHPVIPKRVAWYVRTRRVVCCDIVNSAKCQAQRARFGVDPRGNKFERNTDGMKSSDVAPWRISERHYTLVYVSLAISQ